MKQTLARNFIFLTSITILSGISSPVVAACSGTDHALCGVTDSGCEWSGTVLNGRCGEKEAVLGPEEPTQSSTSRPGREPATLRNPLDRIRPVRPLNEERVIEEEPARRVIIGDGSTECFDPDDPDCPLNQRRIPVVDE